jgi:hypothetical protein
MHNLVNKARGHLPLPYSTLHFISQQILNPASIELLTIRNSVSAPRKATIPWNLDYVIVVPNFQTSVEEACSLSLP